MNRNFRIVLVGTTHPGNIGAAARAMKVMGLSQLFLVNPKIFPAAEASARATGADDILSSACVTTSLRDAIADCHWVVATSARERHLSWPLHSAESAAQEGLQRVSDGSVAYVFGREHSGLSNAEIDLCDALVHIPVNNAYRSLNVAAAVQIISYELFKQANNEIHSNQNKNEGGLIPKTPPNGKLANRDELENFYEHLWSILDHVEFLKTQPSISAKRKLRRIFTKAELDSTEVQLMRGLLKAISRAGR